MKQKRLTNTEALDEIREQIMKVTPQGPSNHRSDEKVEYLYKAVVGAE